MWRRHKPREARSSLAFSGRSRSDVEAWASSRKELADGFDVAAQDRLEANRILRGSRVHAEAHRAGAGREIQPPARVGSPGHIVRTLDAGGVDLNGCLDLLEKLPVVQHHRRGVGIER